MAYSIGFRTVAVLENVTEGNFGRNTPMMLEVTNNGGTSTKIYINDNPSEGFVAQGIPVDAGQTRVIPLQSHWFRADNPVTVVAYRP